MQTDLYRTDRLPGVYKTYATAYHVHEIAIMHLKDVSDNKNII